MALRSKPRDDTTSPPGHHPVGDRRTLAGVQVLEEVVEGGDPLRETSLQLIPLERRDEPGEEIDGPYPLGAPPPRCTR